MRVRVPLGTPTYCEATMKDKIKLSKLMHQIDAQLPDSKILRNMLIDANAVTNDGSILVDLTFKGLKELYPSAKAARKSVMLALIHTVMGMRAVVKASDTITLTHSQLPDIVLRVEDIV